MYCPSCGAETAAGLSYCNRCGASLNQAPVTTQVVRTGSISWPTIAICLTTLGITLGGFKAIVQGALSLGRDGDLGRDPVLALVVIGLFIILITDFMLIRTLSRLIRTTLQPDQSAQPRKRFSSRRAQRQIQTQPPDYVSSVVEHTTRTLEPSLREK